ncbi:bifunctional lysylphosphatidylglycerol flippase/synthetase MprF [Candidatus Brocadia pituitae]|nr:bifunctional lysylphosphatidylglycerol flippase/synthetase MprF [Candidatus Brocadia pituitae]
MPSILEAVTSLVIDLEIVRAIVKSPKKTYVNFTLLGDKAFLLSEHMNVFIMYAVNSVEVGWHWVILSARKVKCLN